MKIYLTADFQDEDGTLKFQDIGLSVLEADERIQFHFFDAHKSEIGSDQLGDAEGVIVLTPSVTRKTLDSASRLLAIGRFGVGYDAVDVQACTDSDVLLYITAGAVDRSVAEATVGWMIALTHHLRTKDILVREGRWDDRSHYMGGELRDRTLGVIGLGGIAKATIDLLGAFGMNQPLAFDPFSTPEAAAEVGVRLVDLPELLAESDFLSIHCPLTDQTRGLLGATELAKMKQGAFLINTARGGIVDEDALYRALEERHIAGAALDCFENEPVTQPHRFRFLPNVLLAPHSIAWTHELFRDIGRAACQGMVDLANGKRPRGCVNPEVFDRPGFHEKWSRLQREV